MEKPKLLIVEDEEAIRVQLKWALAEEYEVFMAANLEEALTIFNKELPHVVTLDLGLYPYERSADEGLSCLSKLLSVDPLVKVMIITGNNDRSKAIEAISRGAHDFFNKPVDIDELKIALKRACYVYNLEKELSSLQEKAKKRPLDSIIGSSHIMEEVFSSVRKVATIDVPVLITGESGTGKELVANAIHALSNRCDEPFVSINCGAIPEGLLESELFGHERGAFTGAHYQKKGKFELAHKGTLFLDEIGELILPLQVKLLRFLQDHNVQRVGGNQDIPIDVRIIAATNRKIEEATISGEFREDLYYRLSVVNISIPPLRKRGDDIIEIALEILRGFALESGKKIRGFEQKALDAIRQYSWPGNVRELENKIKRAVVMSEGEFITSKALGLSTKGRDYSSLLDLNKAREEVEREYALKALDKTGWNMVKAAKELNISRQNLYNIVRKYGFKKAGQEKV